MVWPRPIFWRKRLTSRFWSTEKAARSESRSRMNSLNWARFFFIFSKNTLFFNFQTPIDVPLRIGSKKITNNLEKKQKIVSFFQSFPQRWEENIPSHFENNLHIQSSDHANHVCRFTYATQDQIQEAIDTILSHREKWEKTPLKYVLFLFFRENKPEFQGTSWNPLASSRFGRWKVPNEA